MQINFSPLKQDIRNIDTFAARFDRHDLAVATTHQLDTIQSILNGLQDAHLTFIPDDPDADDPHAPPEERYQGWSLAHIVLHVTASAEEGAAFGSLLARGVPVGKDGLRLRYEPDWHTVRTREVVMQRLAESRRMRLAYLDTWPDTPHLDVYRQFPEDSKLYNKLNAVGAVLFGLMHEQGHFEQMREVRQQVLDAISPADV